MGVLERTGTLEPGKMADVVVWNRNPFSVYARANLVFIDGVVRYDRKDPSVAPESDFSDRAACGPGSGPMKALHCDVWPVLALQLGLALSRLAAAEVTAPSPARC